MRERWTRGWQELPAQAAAKPWKAGGVYWITGGVGGLGLLFAQEIVQQDASARLLLSGRSVLTPAQEQALATLRETGAQVDYERVDITDRAAVDAALAALLARHGALHGILHSAGVVRDNFLLRKSEQELQAVLAPKVGGLVNLDEASAGLALDFFVVFSSLSGALGNAGQADYAAANAFMDAYAAHRNTLVRRGERQGRTVSINWPLWADGGMQVDVATRSALQERFGLSPLQTEAGFAAFYQALASGEDQVLVWSGNDGRVHPALAPPQAAAPAEEPAVTAASAESGAELSEDAAVAYFKRLLAATLKLSPQRLDADVALETYGIDSLLVTQLTAELERSFGPLSKTLFFEYQTLRALAAHFVKAHAPQLRAAMGIAKPAPVPAAAASSVSAPPQARRPALRAGRPRSDAAPAPVAGETPIAIIGLAGRYPQSPDLDAFWRNLRDGKDCISEIPAARWDHAPYSEADVAAAGKAYCRWGGFLDGVDEFDPQFFNIAPREAVFLDPQERLFLQCAYATLEDAGYTRLALKQATAGNVGVYVGVMYEEYPFFGVQAQQQGQAVALSGSPASIANRVSYFCDFHGPSMAVDSMCSSSLTAIHLACESLRRGECDYALAGGVNVSIHPNKYLLLQQGQFSSTTGRCESFGRGGDGYVPGEGVGAVLLKPLAQAIADGDQIHGVIRASAVNHGGKTNGYTVPNPHAQSGVIRRALQRAGVEPAWISYVEAHGTGTSLGDPIEITGLNRAFGAETLPPQSCLIGSVKSNIGHCESAAGIAGLSKVLLQLRHGQVAPSLHSDVLNPNIDFAASPFRVVQELTPWQRPWIDGRELERIAGLSSFGAGGSNAHLIIAEHRGVPAADPASGPFLFPLSARSAEQLRTRARQLVELLRTQGDTAADPADIAYTLQLGREAMGERLAIVAADRADLLEKLERYLAGQAEQNENCYLGNVKAGRDAVAAFARGEEFAETVEKWIARGRLERLAEVWVQGVELDWRRLHGAARRRRVTLPTYPFARERYWVTLDGSLPAVLPAPRVREVSPAAPAQAGEADHALMTFEEVWRAGAVQAAGRAPADVLCVVSQGASCDEVRRSLAVLSPETQVHCLVLPPPAASAAAAQEWTAALRELRAQRRRFDTLLYLVPVDASAATLDTAAVVALLQGLAAADLHCERLLLAAPYADALQRCEADAWLGFARSLPRAWPGAQLGVIGKHEADEQADTSVRLHGWVDLLWQEACHAACESALYEDGVRKLPQLQPCELPAAAVPLRQGGNYLITGGAGGLGLVFAGHLARNYGAHLVLVGRSALDAAKQARLDALRRHAASVTYLSADANDAAALRDALARAQIGPLHGVIHAAGVFGGATGVQQKPLAEFEAVLAAKVGGTQALDQALDGQTPDFICYFSSSSAVLGDFGSCDYAIGNRYQSAYAGYRQARDERTKAIAIQWPLWQDGGMGAGDDAASQLYLRSSGQSALQADEGAALFEQLLGFAGSQCLVMRGEAARVQRYLGLAAGPAQASAAGSGKPSPAVARRAELRGLPLAECVMWDLKSVVGDILKLDRMRLDEQENLADFGFDSVSLAELAARLTAHFDLNISPSVFFSYPTLAKLAAHLLAANRPALETLYGDDADLPAQPSLRRAVAARSARSASLAAPVPAASSAAEPIALIGLSGRFPGARDVAEFWQVLADGRDVVTPMPAARYAWSGASRDGEGCWLGVLPGVAEFDPLFFEISPRE
ncbi:SDR family NAD(P)-dependent oxidoreductase, partial [Tahibacter harae]